MTRSTSETGHFLNSSRSPLEIALIRAFCALLLLLVTLILVDTLLFRKGRTTVAAFRSVQLGATLQEVSDIFGRAPDMRVFVEPYEAAYYEGGFLGRQKCTADELSVKNFEDLPFVYGSMQFLLLENKVIAKSNCGESLMIETIHGNRPGSCLHDLANYDEWKSEVESSIVAPQR